MDRHLWLARFLKCYKATVDLLQRIAEGTEYEYKDISSVDLAEFRECPFWFDGKVGFGYNNEPEAIAHELAHGLHEAIRESNRSDQHGEEFCEAIRFYVETKMQTNSTWLKEFDKQGNPFTMHYGTLARFIKSLETGKLFDDVGWPQTDAEG